jgi:hypothetical protein
MALEKIIHIRKIQGCKSEIVDRHQLQLFFNSEY